MDAKAVETVHALAIRVTGCPEAVGAPARLTAAHGGMRNSGLLRVGFPAQPYPVRIEPACGRSVIKRAVLTLAFPRQIIFYPFKLIHFITSVVLILSPKN